MIKICKACNKRFVAERRSRIYCSYKCSAQSKKKTIIKKCLICNKIIYTILSKIKRKKYCSIKCHNKARFGRIPWNKKPPVIKKCLYCAKIIYTIQSQKHRKKFCSKKCRDKSKIGKPPTNKGKNSPICREKHWHWKGGRFKHKQGYIFILQHNHPFPNNSSGYVFEHRLIMEKYIGRYLTRIEVVHHINKNPSDNRIKNLILFKNDSEHQKHHQKLNRK